MKDKPHIIIVDDDEADRTLMRMAMEEADLNAHIQEYEDGYEIMKYLDGNGTVVLPDLIILDINMPKVGGFEVLKYLKDNPKLSKVPVVIFSTSSNEKDIAMANELGALKYIVKPNDLDGYADLAKFVQQNLQASH
jgi:CheY-like chemotaxis protein